MEYQEINGTPIYDMGCCGLFAAHLVTGKSLQFIFDQHRKMHGKAHNWKGSVNSLDLIDHLTTSLGADVGECYSTRDEDSYMGEYTVEQWSRQWALNSAVYIVVTSNHILTLHNGRYIDQCQDDPVHSASGRRAGVRRVYLVRNSVEIGAAPVSGRPSVTELFDQASDALALAARRHNLDTSKVAGAGSLKGYKLVGFKKSYRKYPFIMATANGRRMRTSVDHAVEVFGVGR